MLLVSENKQSRYFTCKRMYYIWFRGCTVTRAYRRVNIISYKFMVRLSTILLYTGYR